MDSYSIPAAEPRYALVEAYDPADQRIGFLVEPFDPDEHLSSWGYTKAGVSLFSNRSEVEHLRDQILN